MFVVSGVTEVPSGSHGNIDITHDDQATTVSVTGTPYVTGSTLVTMSANGESWSPGNQEDPDVWLAGKADYTVTVTVGSRLQNQIFHFMTFFNNQFSLRFYYCSS